MNQGVWTRLDGTARNLSPFAFTFGLVVMAIIPYRVPGLSAIVPTLGMIAVYFWVVHRPDLMPAWAVFVIGLTQDLIGGGNLGVGTLVLLLVWLVVVSQRRAYSSGSFMLIWALFVLVAGAAQTLTWVLNSLLAGTLIDGRPPLFQYVTTVAIYPCLAWLFVQAQRSFVR